MVCALAAAATGVVVKAGASRDILARVRTEGVLHVAAVNDSPGCFAAEDGTLAGFDCDLLSALAAKLGVRLDVQFYDRPLEVLDAVRSGRAEIGAGGLLITPAARRFVHFSAPMRSVTQQLVYRADAPRPGSLDALSGDIRVVSGSSAADVLRDWQSLSAGLSWSESAEDSADDLLGAVADGELDYTVASSDLVNMQRRYHPQLRVAFDLATPEQRAWAFPAHGDGALQAAARSFLQGYGSSELARLSDHYFGHLNRLSNLDVEHFARDVRRVLPRYRDFFVTAAREYGVDWRLLAAIGYQESHWSTEAISPTGVRGLMMLTTETAAELQVTDRGDAWQSIRGAARYLNGLYAALPDTVAGSDRHWMVLAAYNFGLSHLLDARVIARETGGDPDRWFDVHEALPLLSKPHWYTRLDHGRANSRQVIEFVNNVRSYYDMLQALIEDSQDTGAATLASRTASVSLN